MNLQQCILTENNCYKADGKIVPVGIFLHSTGVNNPYLRRYVQPDDGLLGVNNNGNHWNQPRPDGRDVCVHAFIGRLNDDSIAAYQTLPWDMRCWGCGSGLNGTYNDSHIQFEICEDGLQNLEYFNLVYRESVELAAHLCMLYGIDPANICDHREAAIAGYASNHADVSHWFPVHGKSMDIFRQNVREELETMTYEKWKEYQQRYIKELEEKGPSDWSQEEREFTEKNGIIVGDNIGSKKYKVFCTREQMVVALYRTVKYVLEEVRKLIEK